MQIKSIRDAEVSGKRVLVRVDFNVPIKDGVIADDSRIKAAMPTIKFLVDAGAHVTLMTHLGRPEGKVVESLRTAPLLSHLKTLMPGVEVAMLENVRFDAGDESNDEAFAKKLAEGQDMFVNDAFAVSHRAHASVVGVTKFLPSYAGFLIEEEVAKLAQALTPPAGSVAVIGGAKFETKQPLIEKLLGIYSKILLGGALGNDVIKSRGMPIGASLVSSIGVPISIAANEQLDVASDAVFDGGAEGSRTGFISDTRAAERIVDIGPTTALHWAGEVSKAPFVLWNGPMGIYENGFTGGTDVMAKALVDAGVQAVIGGGDTIAAITKFSFDPNKVFLSTGGGAMLEFLANGTLPGIEVLKK